MLSALAHPELEVVTAAIPAISELPEDRGRLYLDVIMAALPPSVRKLLETQMLQRRLWADPLRGGFVIQCAALAVAAAALS